MSSQSNFDNSLKGIGGAPTRATTLPESAAERKKFPVANGVLDYFPDAIVAIAALSQKGNDQHNPGKPLHWDRSKSGDEADTMLRHFLQRGTLDTDGMRHSAKMAWRALALLQKEIESESVHPQEREKQFPKYWFNRGDNTIYRASSAMCPGYTWEYRGLWTKCAVSTQSMVEYAALWSENYIPISAEKAKELGAKI